MQIGPYTVDEALRKAGGQAFVYFSTDPLSGERVAIKVARPSEWSRKRMKKEIQVQGALTHPNILRVVRHAEDFSWYATREAECSLEDLGPFPREQWQYFRAGMLGVVSAVAHAHAAGYVHRDLSPGNILVFSDGWAVADWGFVYVSPRGGPRQTQPLERFGTPDFMAPEMAVDPRQVGPPADIYSIGRLAVWGTGLSRGDADPEDPASRWWRQLIDGATRYEPDARWTMHDVQTHLRSELPSEGPGRTKSPGVLGSPFGRLRRGEPCPNCRSDVGCDSAERCLRCHAIIPY
jgi:serine/threonine protein kinase